MKKREDSLNLGCRQFGTMRGRSCVLICFFALPLAAQQAGPAQPKVPAQALTAPVRQVQIKRGFPPVSASPVVSNGYFVAFTRDITPNKSSRIILTSLDTGVQVRISLSLAAQDLVGVSKSQVHAVAVTPDSRLVLVGSYSLAGADSGGFVSTMDLSGKVLSTASLGGFAPASICADIDGSFWAIGMEANDESQTKPHTYPMLRNYTSGGILKRSYFARNLLPTGQVDFRPRGNTFGKNVDDAYISCGGSTIGAYVASKGMQYWLEVKPQTGEANQWSVLPFDGVAQMTGMVFFGAHTAYGSFYFQDSDSRGLGRLVISSKNGTARWARVPMTNRPANTPAGATVLGAHQSNLVYWLGPVGATTFPMLYWSKP